MRDGTDRGEVTAIFSLESYSKVNLILDEAGIKQSDELIIRRVNFLDGRKSAWINDKRVSSEFLRNLGENLIEFHGQHDERGLLDAKGHLQLLDQFAQTAPFLNSVKKAFLILKENQKAVETFIRENQKLTEEEDLIRHNLEEISNLGTYSGEEAELDTKRRLMQNSQSIRENISEASVLVDRDAAEGQLSNAIKWLEKAANNVENVLDEPIEALRRAQSELQEAQSAIFDVLSSLSFNSEELEILEDRLFSIRGANIIVGSTLDTELEGKMRVSVVATGIEAEQILQSSSINTAETSVLAVEEVAEGTDQNLSFEEPIVAETQAIFEEVDNEILANREFDQSLVKESDGLVASSQRDESLDSQSSSPGIPSADTLARLRAAVTKGTNERSFRIRIPNKFF